MSPQKLMACWRNFAQIKQSGTVPGSEGEAHPMLISLALKQDAAEGCKE